MRRSRHRFVLAALSCLLSATAAGAETVPPDAGQPSTIPFTLFDLRCTVGKRQVFSYAGIRDFYMGDFMLQLITPDDWTVQVYPPRWMMLTDSFSCGLEKLRTIPAPGENPRH